MTTFFLIRHGTHSRLGNTLVGRMAQVHLSDDGRAQAERLAARLAGERLDLVSAGPLERAQETALPIARRTGAPLETSDALTEVEIGEWAGRSFDALAADPRWRHWNERRSIARAPGGETMSEVTARAVGHLEALRRRLPEGRVAMVSHCDVIRPVLFHHLGLSLDRFDAIEISPGSLSVLVVGDVGARILSLNEVPR